MRLFKFFLVSKNNLDIKQCWTGCFNREFFKQLCHYYIEIRSSNQEIFVDKKLKKLHFIEDTKLITSNNFIFTAFLGDIIESDFKNIIIPSAEILILAGDIGYAFKNKCLFCQCD